MTARYIIRFDDVCETSNWENLARITDILNRRRIRPIVGVVPDNQHPALQVADPVPDFWDRVRQWQALGWTIAAHGYQHLMTSIDPGEWWHDPRSEFAGHPEEEQQRLLSAAMAVFESEDVVPTAWMAPNHTFDAVTVKLVTDAGIDVVTDGPGLLPYRGRHGELWIPCQLWDFVPKRFGVWTVCYHADSWTSNDLDAFERLVETHYRSFTSVDLIKALFTARDSSLVDRGYSTYRLVRRRVG